MPQQRPLSTLGWPKQYDLQTPPLGGPQDPDPQPGRRVSLRPQPRRAPREEAMALGPLRGVLAGWLRLDATTISAAGGVRVPQRRPPSALGWPKQYDLQAMLLGRCGDIHPRPGPLQVESANVTSLRRHWRQVMTSKSDIVCLQETGLTAAGQRAMAALARKMGWCALWGAPLDHNGAGVWDTGPGGVGILYRPCMVMQLAARPADDEAVQALWASGRWMHAHLAHAEGRSILNVQVAYGIVAQKRPNAQLWKAVLRYTARLGNSLQIICADFNFRLSDENDMPREMFTALRKGLVVDVMRARAEARGHQPCPTYQGGSGAETRIDGILTDPRVASLVHEERVIKEPGLPGHSLLRVSISLDMANQKVTKIRNLQVPEEHSMHTEERQRLASIFWDSMRRPWKAAVCAEDVNGMWHTWTWAAEEFLLMELGEDSTVESALRVHWPGPPVVKADPMELEKRVRGTSHTVATTKLCPNKKLPSGAPKTRAIRIMDAVKGALKQVLRYVRAQEQAGLTRVGGWPRGVEPCWLSAHRGMDQLQQERPPPPGGDCGAFARQTMRCPDARAAHGGPGSGGTSASAGGGEGASAGLVTVDR